MFLKRKGFNNIKYNQYSNVQQSRRIHKYTNTKHFKDPITYAIFLKSRVTQSASPTHLLQVTRTPCLGSPTQSCTLSCFTSPFTKHQSTNISSMKIFLANRRSTFELLCSLNQENIIIVSQMKKSIAPNGTRELPSEALIRECQVSQFHQHPPPFTVSRQSICHCCCYCQPSLGKFQQVLENNRDDAYLYCFQRNSSSAPKSKGSQKKRSFPKSHDLMLNIISLFCD